MMYKSTHCYEPLTSQNRPQDPTMDGKTLRFRTLEHGGEFPDTMPQAIEVTDADGRSATYVPVTEHGVAVKSRGYAMERIATEE